MQDFLLGVETVLTKNLSTYLDGCEVRDAANSSPIPSELRNRDQWVVWRYQTRDGKPTKVPYQSSSIWNEAKADDPSTWGSYADAVQAHKDAKGDLAGIGFEFSDQDPFVGIDLDDSLDEHGKPLPWAQDILNRIVTYTEVSPSGKGLKLFLKGPNLANKGRNNKKEGKKRETYFYGRYFTVTGQVLDGRTTIEDCSQAYTDWFMEVFKAVRDPKSPKTPSTSASVPKTFEPYVPPTLTAEDIALIERAKVAANGEKFCSLWEGKWEGWGYPSRSESVLGLLNMLVFWCRRDAVQMERIAAASKLCESYHKWVTRVDYRDSQIAEALADSVGRDVYTPPIDSEHLAEWEPSQPSEQIEQTGQQVKADSKFIRLQESWFCPELLTIRNAFFREYETMQTLQPKDRLLITASFSFMAGIKAIVGKHLYCNPISSELTYCGADAILVIQDSGDGKSQIYKEVTNVFYPKIAGEDYVFTTKATFPNALKNMRKKYIPDVVSKGKSLVPSRADIKAACESNSHSIFMLSDEVAGGLAKLAGSWSQGTQDSTGEVLEMLEGKAMGYLSTSSNNNGTEYLYDMAILLFGATTPDQLRQNYNLYSEDKMLSGMAARIAIVFDDPDLFDYEKADITVGNETPIISRIKALYNSSDTYRCIVSKEARDGAKALTFEATEDQQKFEAFKAKHPKFWKSAKDKLLTRSISDAMLWAFLAGDPIKPLEQGWVLSQTQYRDQVCQGIIDCSKYVDRCYKLRTAMLINAFAEYGVNIPTDYRQKLLDTLEAAPLPMKKKQLIDAATDSNGRKYHNAEETLNELVKQGIVLAQPMKGTGGRPALLYSLNKVVKGGRQ